MKWICDSGHAWLKVRKSQLSPKSKSKISCYSYENGDFLYLEEDCDSAIFFADYFNDEKWFLKQEFLEAKENLKIQEEHFDGYCYVRSYKPYLHFEYMYA